MEKVEKIRTIIWLKRERLLVQVERVMLQVTTECLLHNKKTEDGTTQKVKVSGEWKRAKTSIPRSGK